ncbi:dihydroneopterin aldolase [Candidatus Uhrbacteria bacterium]|nr:dihydroneopterin aldolase [Candidatus Uhrbacteria bacterium]
MSASAHPTQTTILVRGLAIRAHVGVATSERRAPQTVVMDVEIQLANPAIARDHMSASVNYAMVVRLIEEVAAVERAALLETIAERIAFRIFDDARVAGVALTITKPQKIPNCSAVGVRRTFQRAEVTP